MGEEEAIKILEKLFKPLYENAGIEWTEKQDKHIMRLVMEIDNIAEIKSKNVLHDHGRRFKRF